MGEGGGGLIETGGLFNLAKTMVSVLHKELEYKVEKLKNKKLDVMQPRIKKKPNFQLRWIRYPESVHTKFYSRDWLIQSIIYYWRIIRGRGEGGLLTFFPRKEGGGAY